MPKKSDSCSGGPLQRGAPCHGIIGIMVNPPLTAPPPMWTGHNWRTVRVVRFKKQCTRSGVLGSMRVGAASNYQTVSAIHLVSRISRNWGIFVAVKIPLGLLVKRIYRQLNAITPPHRGFIGQCIIIMIVMIFWDHQYKAAGRKTRLDIRNYGCSGNLLCYHGVVERNRISCLQSHEKALEKECSLPGVSVIVMICLPISCVSSMAISCHVPAISMASG